MMIRVLFDQLGDSHSDLFIKLDAMPSLLIVSDSFFLEDFLEIVCETKQEVILEYIKYFKKSVDQLADKELFVPTDLSDEYIGGLIIKNRKKGLVEITKSYNRNLYGWSITKSNIHSEAERYWTSFQKERIFLFSKESIINGLDWSIMNLEKK